MSLQSTEAECAANAVAPRVALADIEAAIADVSYTTAENAFFRTFDGVSVNPDSRVMTLCLVTMRNSFMVIGKSAPASTKNFNADLGKKLAYEDCIRQLWPLMGFALREKLAAENRHAPGAPHISTKSTELDSH